MSYALGPVSTQDVYDSATTRETGIECVRLTGWISNAPVYYQLYRADQANWSEEKYVPSAPNQTAFLTFSRKFNGVRFRSATPGLPALIALDLLTVDDIPGV